ncbi:cytidine deaminase [Mobilicoccus pelagius]|uniref:Cytidine deaminase n=1 Tax=Mobilicoccus pelagius NBRC 104925 TaxID=1089455 RepID=H5US42_9MICO|nr:cytidine deaminase [Mobilicoccus pelagius]GAB48550.1 cytidine deaminase [Mobilicoccus pelagius NBRC 104925]
MTTPPQVPDDAQLLELAREAATKAYIPYSTFPVGAALLTASGEVVQGCNVENASYGLTICAERTATTRMIVSSDGPDDADARRIVKVAIVGLKASPCFPCGACRQVLHEFGCQSVIVEEDGAPRAYPFAEILPHGFGPADLENPEG